jgi:hypothetical protein
MFIEQCHNTLFQQQGYLVLPLLEEKDILYLENLYAESESDAQVKESFYTSVWSPNKAYRKFVYEKVSPIMFNRVAKFLLDSEPIFSNFHVKKGGGDSALIPHQDWNFVDETKHQSMTIWCPLTNVDEKNGALQVLLGSHRMSNYVRGRFFDSPFNSFRDTAVKAKMTSVPMKAGEAIFFHSRLIHASSPNFSNDTRVAASVVVAPNGTPIVHDVLDRKSATVKRMNVSPDFFYNYSCYDDVLGVAGIEQGPYRNEAISEIELDAVCGRA